MIGQKIKELREARGLVQRQLATKLDVDVAYISKMESNDKPVSRNHLKILSQLLGISEQELKTLWLADKLYDLAKNEDVGLEAIEAAENELKLNKKKKSK